MMFSDMSAALPLIRSGKVRALGSSTAKRVAGAPELPSVAENGVPGYDAAAWQMVAAPANMPKPVVEKLYKALLAIEGDLAFRASVVERGFGPLLSPPPAELEQFVRAEIVRWGKVAEEAAVARTQ